LPSPLFQKPDWALPSMIAFAAPPRRALKERVHYLADDMVFVLT
jgi:hypothetical protein